MKICHRIVNSLGGGFDFTTETQSTEYDEYRDIAWYIIVDHPQLRVRLTPVLGRAYVMLTGDGVYLKFAVREFEPYVGLVLEYYGQKAGTNNPRDDIIVPVRTTTWGGFEALY